MGSGASNTASFDKRQLMTIDSYDSLIKYVEEIDDSCIQQINLYKCTIHFNPRQNKHYGTVVCFLSEFVHHGYTAAIISKHKNKIEISLFKENTQIAITPPSLQQPQAFKSNVVNLHDHSDVMLIWDNTGYFKLKTTDRDNTKENAQSGTQEQQHKNLWKRYAFFMTTYVIGLALYVFSLW